MKTTSHKWRLKTTALHVRNDFKQSLCNFKILTVLTELKHIFFFTHLWSTVTLRSELKGWKQEREKSYHVSFSSQTIVPFLSWLQKNWKVYSFVTLETTNMRNSYGIFHKHFKAELNKSLISVAHTYPFENFLEFFLWFPTYNRIFTRLKNEHTQEKVYRNQQ